MIIQKIEIFSLRSLRFKIFLNEISHKFPKGYPDLNNKQDITLLHNLFEEIGVPLVLEEQT